MSAEEIREPFYSAKEIAEILKDKNHSKEFGNLAHNESKINYILTKVKSKESYQTNIKILINSYRTMSMKNDQLAIAHIQTAKEHIKFNEYNDALIQLNEAILNAAVSYGSRDLNETDPIYLAYFQRSIALLELQDFETAIHDTEICLNIFPTNRMILQKAKCLKHILKFEEAKQLVEEVLRDLPLRVSTEGSSLKDEFMDRLYEIQDKYRTEEQPNLPIGYYDLWISDNVKFVSSNQMGRYLSAKEFIPKNTVYLYEKTIHVLLLEENILSYCSNCNKHLKNKFWPCYGCNEVVFCDQKCLKEGMKRFHQFECGLTKLFYSFGIYWFQAFRLFLSSGIISARNLVVFRNKVFMNPNIGWNLHNWIESHANKCQPEVKSKEESFAEFKAILTFMDNKQNLGSEETQLILEAIETSVLIEYTNAFHFEDEWVFIKFVDFLLTQRLKIYFNLFFWRENITRRPLAICFYIMGCFINHSCVPNSYQDSTNKYLKLITNRDVQQWEDLTISYGPNAEMSFFQRQRRFRDFCHFQCLCELCLEQVKRVPALQCLHCDGPVFYNDGYYNDICMKCGQKYQNFLTTAANVEEAKSRVNDSFTDIENGIHVNESLQSLEQDIDILCTFIYRESYELAEILSYYRVLELPFYFTDYDNQLREFY